MLQMQLQTNSYLDNQIGINEYLKEIANINNQTVKFEGKLCTDFTRIFVKLNSRFV